MANLDELQSKLKGNDVTHTFHRDSINIQNVDQPENLKKSDKPKKGQYGGKRPNSGRKKTEETLLKQGVKAWLAEHGDEKIPITVVDKKTGQQITIMKPRIAYAMEKLFEIGTAKTATQNGNAAAIDLWLNRLWGRAAQPIRGEGEDDPPIKLHVDNLAELIKKVYGSDK